MFSGDESPEADPGDRHVVGERAPEDQQVSLALFLTHFLLLSTHFCANLMQLYGAKKKAGAQ